MLKFLIIFLFIFNIYNQAMSSKKEGIISKLEKTYSLSFNFKQSIDEYNEEGQCIIKYPKKIYCEYNNTEKKIIVSDGKSLVIKNRNSGTYYIYPLKKTVLEFFLNKDYLINQMKNLEPRNIDNKYLNFEISENNNKINIFFDYETFDLIGWQIEDIYQNLVITFISSIKINGDINDDLFKLPNKD
jgi:outer membrane lipoprotein-sorting protein